VSEGAFRRCTVSLDRDTLRMCRELAKSESQSISSAIRMLVRRGYREAVREGRIAATGPRASSGDGGEFDSR
jgi:hypothetical protein